MHSDHTPFLKSVLASVTKLASFLKPETSGCEGPRGGNEASSGESSLSSRAC